MRIFPFAISLLILCFCSSTGQAQTCNSNNEAANKTTVASDGNDIGGNVVDGNLTTDWYGASDSKWIYVDLGSSQSLCKVTLKWGYWSGIPQTKVQGSNNTTTWDDLYTVPANDHGNHAGDNTYDYIDVDLSSVTTAYRYVRLYYPSGTSWGPHLKEVEVYVKADIVYPTVEVTYPTSGLNFTQGSNITLSASASLQGGSITKVEFFEGTNKIGEDLTIPYNITWNNVQVGSYNILAYAYGSNGQTKVSNPVSINVSIPASGWLIDGNTAIPANAFLGTTDSKPLVFKTNNLERLRITESGTVAINAGSDLHLPNDAALAVEGLIYTRKLRVTQLSWADYVFDKNYRLRPLNELETYIIKYKHLPGIPSAQKIRQNGLDVGESQKLLLKKIEELTLYIIEQHKKIELLEKQNKELSEIKSDVELIKAKLKNK
jgi:hypothetical protein